MSRLLPFAGILFLCPPAIAGDGPAHDASALLSVVRTATSEARPGESAIARVRQEDAVFEVQVTAPHGQALDPRVLRWASGQEEAESAAAETGEPMDLSGYRIRVDKVAGAACSATFSIKPKPVTLAANRGWIFESGTAIAMDIAAFPTKGDVDTAIFLGPNLDTCDGSFRGKLQMDQSACILTNCTNTSANTLLQGIVGNITTAQATYAGTYHLFFASLP